MIKEIHDRYTNNKVMERVAIAGLITEKAKSIANELVVVGGSAVEFYTAANYMTNDLDFVARNEHGLAELMHSLGFQLDDQYRKNQFLSISRSQVQVPSVAPVKNQAPRRFSRGCCFFVFFSLISGVLVLPFLDSILECNYADGFSNAFSFAEPFAATAVQIDDFA